MNYCKGLVLKAGSYNYEEDQLVLTEDAKVVFISKALFKLEGDKKLKSRKLLEEIE